MANEQTAQSAEINLKAILLLVIIACAALVAFVKLRVRNAPKPVTIVRGPLHPLGPPITADVAFIVADLRARQFDKLEQMLTAYQAAAEKEVVREVNVSVAFQAFSRTDTTFGQALQEWLKQSPGSYAAHLAMAEFLSSEGWSARGSKLASETSDEQFRKMRAYLAASAEEERNALAINPKLTEAYALLIDEVKTEGGVTACIQMMVAGLRQVPASFEIRRAAMNCSRPRWGGSYRQMDELATQAQAEIRENPQLLALKGFADLDRGEILSGEDKYDAAIVYYTRALQEGGDYSPFYYNRAEALKSLRRFDEALEDLHRATQLDPQSADVFESIAYVLAMTGKFQDALAELNTAEAIEGPVPYEQQLRKEIMASLNQHSPETGTSGN